MKSVIRREHVAVDALAAEPPASSRGEGADELKGPVLPIVDRDLPAVGSDGRLHVKALNIFAF